MNKLRKYLFALAPAVVLIFYGFYVTTIDESGLGTVLIWFMAIILLFGGLIAVLLVGITGNSLDKPKRSPNLDTRSIQLRDALLCFAATLILAGFSKTLNEGSNAKKSILLIASIPFLIGGLRIYSFLGSLLKQPLPFYSLKQQYKLIAIIVFVPLIIAFWLTFGQLWLSL